MRVVVSPHRLEVSPGVPTDLEITVTNPGTVIGGYTLRLLGLDPGWVELDADQVSLFPDETRTFTASITIPVGLVAGERRMAVQLREETPPFRTSVEEIVLVVPAAPNLQLRVDPVVVTSGKRGRFSLLVDNTGNTPLVGHLVADDSEAKLAYEFEPPVVDLAPGEHRVVDLQVKGRRPWLGTPLVRLINLHVHDDPPPPPAPKPSRLRRKPHPAAAPAAPPPETPIVGNATFIQKARLARGALSLVGLLVALTVFAVVITVALSNIVGQSAADRDLALKIAAAQDGGGTGTGTSRIVGAVVEATSQKPARGVEVTLYGADDLTTPVAKAVTTRDGGYAFPQLPAGDYKLFYQGAGLQSQWYPQALGPDDAAAVPVEEAKDATLLDVPLGGIPGQIEGKVVGTDVTDATLTLRSLIQAPAGGADYDAEVTSVSVDPDGSFVIGNVPSPSTYNLEVSKQGYASATQQVEVRPGETVTGVKLPLLSGNGRISGNVVSNDGVAIGSATVTLSSGDTSIAAVTASDGPATGTYDLAHLPTPATYTMTVTATGYTAQTLTLTLGDAQSLTGVSVALVNSSGRLSGRTLLQSEEGTEPTGGVTVRVSDGVHVVQTASRSPEPRPASRALVAARDASTVPVGSWSISGLTLPGIYNVTFSRADLTSQTVSISLDVNGNIATGSLGVVVDDAGIRAVMHRATGEVTGLVTQDGAIDDQGIARGIGEVLVTMTSGTTTYTVTTASAGAYVGSYHVSDVLPGTYTISFSRSGVRPSSTIVTVVGGQTTEYNPNLDEGATISISVVSGTGAGQAPVNGTYYVAVYRSSDYPALSYREGYTTGAGTLEIDDVDAPEVYVVQVSRGPLTEPLGSAQVTVKASETSPVKVRIDSP